MAVAVCPSCGETIKISNQPKVGQKVTCNYCDELLEVVDLNPVELDWAYYDDDDEDWEESDDEDWDNNWDNDD